MLGLHLVADKERDYGVLNNSKIEKIYLICS
jgi:hypothetical protein